MNRQLCVQGLLCEAQKTMILVPARAARGLIYVEMLHKQSGTRMSGVFLCVSVTNFCAKPLGYGHVPLMRFSKRQ